MTVSDTASAIADALALIARTPGYEADAEELTRLLKQGKLRCDPDLPDRGQASLSGIVRIGPEALDSGLVSLAATLIHENFHRHQNPLLKTASFWRGVATRTDTMRRYEAPAYAAAAQFLLAVAATFPDLAATARQEADATRAAFNYFYGEAL